MEDRTSGESSVLPEPGLRTAREQTASTRGEQLSSAGPRFGDQNAEPIKVIEGDVDVTRQGAAGLPGAAQAD